MHPRDIEKKVMPIAEDLASSTGLVVVDVSYRQARGSWVLEVCLYRPEGISTDDCARFSHSLGDRLDVESFMPSSYHLEVASPGLDRTLRSEREYGVFSGRQVVIRTYDPVEGRKNFKGILRGLDEDQVILEEENGLVLRLPIEKIARTKLHVEF